MKFSISRRITRDGFIISSKEEVVKKVISLTVALVLCALCLTSCFDKTEEKKEKPTEATTATEEIKIDRSGTKVLFKDDYKSEKVTATLVVGSTGDNEPASIEKLSEDDDAVLYACYGDADSFNKIYFTCDGDDTIELAFNNCVSGWHRKVNGIVPFTDGKEEADVIDYALETFDFEGYEKEVYICTPDSYDKNRKEKYPVIYMTDGQNLFEKNATTHGSWGVYESMRSVSEDKQAVIVGVANPSTTRDKELTPDIGDVTTEPDIYENGKGKEFSDFVADVVVPFVEKNYNVRTDPDGVAICGSSSGGIECFYIGMEHPEKFGTIGALSPAFGLFDDATWAKHLSKKDFSKNNPLVYIYCGAGDTLEAQLNIGADAMPKTLADAGFPAENITTSFYEQAMHNEAYWRAIFPEFLKWFYADK